MGVRKGGGKRRGRESGCIWMYMGKIHEYMRYIHGDTYKSTHEYMGNRYENVHEKDKDRWI